MVFAVENMLLARPNSIPSTTNFSYSPTCEAGVITTDLIVYQILLPYLKPELMASGT